MRMNCPFTDLTLLVAVTGGPEVSICVFAGAVLLANTRPDQLGDVPLCVWITGPQDNLKLTIVEDNPAVLFAVKFVELSDALYY